MSDIEYRKEYLPGYTGHVPKKNEVYGCTAGDINKIITKTGYKPSNYDVDIAVGKPNFAQRDFYANPPPKDVTNEAMQYGNHSKFGDNWLGGPTQNIKAQHIPGYAGYVPQISSENLCGKGFTRTTADSINGDYIKGADPPKKERFMTENQREFAKDNFRRLKNDIDPAEIKDQVDAANFHDAEFQGIEIQEKQAYMDLPTVGYQGHQSLYRKPVTKVEHRKDPFFNLNPLRPRLKDRDVRTTDDYQKMSVGFQIAMNSGKAREEAGLPNNQEVKIPVVGYTGHRMGYRSQNFYGKNFRDCSIQAKMVQKMAN